MLTNRLGLRDLVSIGPSAIARYTGTLLTVFVVQSIVATACMLGVAVVLAHAFAYLPIFDDAVDGDLVSLAWCLRHARASFAASGGIVFAAVLLWQLASWFLVGGLYGVLAQRPEGRAGTARCFGASGAATYLAYARLALCSLPGLLVAVFAFGSGLTWAIPRLERALSVGDLVAPLCVALVPALLILHLLWTISDYARVELTLRLDSHDPGIVATYLRTTAFVLRRPITLVHSGLGWLVCLLVTLGYAYLAHGHPMYGAEGAVTLFVIRQGVALARSAIRVGVLTGQVELGNTRALPPRRREPGPEPAK
jgi:hypothetical protein